MVTNIKHNFFEEFEMPIKVEVLPNEPIILLQYLEFVSAQEFKNMYEETAPIVSDMIAKGLGKKVYRIGNSTGLKSDFMEVMKAVQLAASEVPGATGDPRITSIMVGTEVWARLFINMVSQPQFGSIKMPFFKTIDEALEYCRLDIKEQQANP
jgi:hypothetical protein